jgi:hypothetical protein
MFPVSVDRGGALHLHKYRQKHFVYDPRRVGRASIVLYRARLYQIAIHPSLEPADELTSRGDRDVAAKQTPKKMPNHSRTQTTEDCLSLFCLAIYVLF